MLVFFAAALEQNRSVKARPLTMTPSQVEEVLLVQAMKKGTVSGLRSGREYMSQAAAEGAGMLLRRWPEGIEALSELGNSPLPEAMRREAWLAKVDSSFQIPKSPNPKSQVPNPSPCAGHFESTCADS
jgi:hypothetical protein